MSFKGLNDVQKAQIGLIQKGISGKNAELLVRHQEINLQTLSTQLSKDEYVKKLIKIGIDKEEAEAIWKIVYARQAENMETEKSLKGSKRLGTLISSMGISGILSVATTVASVVSGVVSAIKQHQEEIRQAGQAAAQEWQSMADSLSDYKDELSELSEKLKDSNISEEDRISAKSRLLEIQKELNEAYGNEVSNIDLINGKYEEQIALLDELAGKKASDWLATNPGAARQARKAFTTENRKIITNYLSTESFIGQNGDTSLQNEFLRILDQNGVELTRTGGTSAGIKTITSDLETRINNLTNLSTALEELSKTHNLASTNPAAANAIEDLQKEISKVLQEDKQVRDDNLDNWEQTLLGELEAEKGYFQSVNSEIKSGYELYVQLADAADSYNQAVLSGDTTKIKETSDRLDGLKGVYNEFITQDDNYQYARLFDPIINGILDIEEYITNSMPLFGEYMNTVLRSFGITPDTSNIRATIGRIIEWFNGLTEAAKVAANAMMVALSAQGLVTEVATPVGNGAFTTKQYTFGSDSAIKALQDQLDNSGYTPSSGGGGGSSSPYSEAYETQKDLTEHYIKMSELRQHSMEEDSDQWRYEQQQQLDYYMQIAELIKAEMERLKAAGVDASSEAMRSLEKEYQSTLNNIYDIQKKQFEAQKQTALDAIDAQIEAAEEAHDELMDQYDARIKKQEALIDLEEKYNDVLNSLRKEQNELDKQYSMAQDAYVTASPAEREALFSTDDYRELSDILSELENEVNTLYSDYWAKLESVTAENIYMADYYTSQLETQLDLVSARYEIAKQELAVSKAKIALENTLQERNVATLVNGKWTWVADPDAVKSAMDEMYEAEQSKADAQSDYIHSQKVAEMSEYLATIEMEKAAAEMEHEKLMDQLQDQRDAIEDATFNANMFATGVGEAYSTLASGVSSGMSAISSAISTGISAVSAAAAAAASARYSGGSSGSLSSVSSKGSGLNPGGYELADQWWTPWYEDEADRILKNAAVLEEAGIPYQIVTDDIGRSYITYEKPSILTHSIAEVESIMGAIGSDATGGMYDYYGYSNNPNYLKDTIGISREELNQSKFLAGLNDLTIYNAYKNWGNNSAASSRDHYVNTTGVGGDFGSFGGEGWIKAEDVVSEIAKIGKFEYLENIGIGYTATQLPYKHKYSFSEGGVVDYQGIALVHGKNNRPEMVLNNADTSKLYNLIHNTPNLAGLIAEKFKSALAPNGKVSGALNRIFGSTTDNSKQIYVNGVEIKGADGDNLISIFERVLPTLT